MRFLVFNSESLNFGEKVVAFKGGFPSQMKKEICGLTMSSKIPFTHEFNFEYRKAQTLTPLIRRVVADNPSPFAFKGTELISWVMTQSQ